jgi:hypothetical protein
MGFYPTMGVLTTIDGELYRCNPNLCSHFNAQWSAAQASEVEFQVQRLYNLSRLDVTFQGECVNVIFQPPIRCAMWKLTIIQNAVRNWLHRRKTSLRQEVMLFLRTFIPADVVDVVENVLQLTVPKRVQV